MAEVAIAVVGLLERAEHERCIRRAAVPAPGRLGGDQPARLAGDARRPGAAPSARAAAASAPRARRAARPGARPAAGRAARGPGRASGTRRALEQRGDLLVGEDHQPLDQPVGLGLRDAAGGDDVAVLVEAELGLAGFDVELAAGAALARAPRPPRGRSPAARRPRRGASLAPGEDPVELVVVEARVGADQAAVEARTSAARPPGPSSISAVTASRSTPGARLQASSLSARGSIGSTVPGT